MRVVGLSLELKILSWIPGWKVKESVGALTTQLSRDNSDNNSCCQSVTHPYYLHKLLLHESQRSNKVSHCILITEVECV